MAKRAAGTSDGGDPPPPEKGKFNPVLEDPPGREVNISDDTIHSGLDCKKEQ